ncbi:cation-dependent mannose-6-phosphate receptor-like [Antedon mediterranea]|uniref:cation-dependent mannose-6-phosphate receptor-like n=1 Tax=Antedon mediterranea TaxID=105859 RepID=UPI003AF60CF1
MLLFNLLQFLIFSLLFPCFYCNLCKESPPSTFLCTLQDGSKIDISSLGDRSGKSAKYSAVSGDYKYTYNPRYSYTVGQSSVCKDAAACQTDKDNDAEFLIAEQKVDSWSSCTADQSSSNFVICINYTPVIAPGATRNVIVKLLCNKDGKSSFTATDNGATTYTFTLEDKEVCPKFDSGLSVGSILCILFTVLLIVYLIAGVLINRFIRGAAGKELFPNYQFWTGFPSLVKDGVLLSISPCKKDSEYDAI